MFSLLRHLSSSDTWSSEPHQPFHISHFRKIVSSLLLCPPSWRKPKTSELNAVIDADVLNLFYQSWLNMYVDIRWFFLRESTCVWNIIIMEKSLSASFRTLMKNHSASEYPNVENNLLSILELLKTFPTEQSELTTWWVTELSTKPTKSKKDVHRIRLQKMTVHQSLHSLSSHRTMFTRAWLTLLPRLFISGDIEKTKAYAARALSIMHRGVVPHLTKPILIMDWITACVDLGIPLSTLDVSRANDSYVRWISWPPRSERIVYSDAGIQSVCFLCSLSTLLTAPQRLPFILCSALRLSGW